MDGLTIALERIARERAEKTGFLDLGGLGLSELPDELFRLQHLRRLNLGKGYFDERVRWHDATSDFEPNSVAAQIHRLAELGELRHLSRVKTDLSDLSPLAGLSNLQLLFCWSTQVSDLSPLRSLTNLKSLGCSETQVSDLSPLAGLSNLQLVNCLDTQVSDLSPLRSLAIPKLGGGTRNLGIPPVVDRVVQQALAQKMSPIFEPLFADSSFG